MSAIDILSKLNGLTSGSLDPVQRVLLVTDGTLTEILEAIFLERIELIKLAQEIVTATASHAMLDISPGQNETLIERKVLLRGGESGTNYAYAESLIAADRLGAAFRDELLNSNTPLGRLWLEHRLETYKDLQSVEFERAEHLSRYFACTTACPLFVRTYRVFSACRPVMLIAEHFPTKYCRSAALLP